MKPSSNNAYYRPDIDGLRALAVVAVLLFHAKIGCPGGYVGVDIFFVISGYLISQIIFKKLDENRFHFGDFYLRRIDRILPASIVAGCVTVLAGYVILLPPDYSELGQSAAAQALHVSNYFFWSVSGYFDHSAGTKPLLHTWSLGVEMQFYLIFPIFVFAINWFAPRHLPKILGLCFLLSLSLSECFQDLRH